MSSMNPVTNTKFAIVKISTVQIVSFDQLRKQLKLTALFKLPNYTQIIGTSNLMTQLIIGSGRKTKGSGWGIPS